jgi:ubiquinone/menaquinone biosynthesis C-methylase UbiE
MEKKEYEKMFRLEETHWWFAAKRALVIDLLAEHTKMRSIRRILDAGCGTGIMLKELQKFGEAWGIDQSPEAISFSEKRMAGVHGYAPLLQASVCNLPFADNSFDAVTCLDLLYHRNVENDEAALKEIARVCRPGAVLILTDSALPSLWSRHDQLMHAARRYTVRQIHQKLTNANFNIIRLSYSNFLLFPPALIMRKIDLLYKGQPFASIHPVHPTLNRLLFLISRFEAFLFRYINFPVGSSIICVAEKKGSISPR